jgi:hypothetical protein
VIDSVQVQRIVSFKPKYVTWVWNGLAVFGFATLIYLGAQKIANPTFGFLCDVSVLDTSINSDSTAKATIFKTECGAAAADRIHVALSNAEVDGTKQGFEVATLLNIHGGMTMKWTTPRTLVVSYPASGEVEYQVVKTRGITVQVNAE